MVLLVLLLVAIGFGAVAVIATQRARRSRARAWLAREPREPAVLAFEIASLVDAPCDPALRESTAAFLASFAATFGPELDVHRIRGSDRLVDDLWVGGPPVMKFGDDLTEVELILGMEKRLGLTTRDMYERVRTVADLVSVLAAERRAGR